MTRRGVLAGVAAIALLVVAGTRAEATPIALVNPGFETGTLTGWTTFITANGTLGPFPLPNVVLFDVDGDSVSTKAARFQVGEITFQHIQEGGGIFQNFESGAGWLALSVDIASQNFSDHNNNGAGGLFTLFLDGIGVDILDFGLINFGVTERDTLDAIVPVTAGTHEIRISMTRPFLTGGDTPFQFIDNVAIDHVAPIPEPTTLALLGAGLAGLAARGRRVCSNPAVRCLGGVLLRLQHGRLTAASRPISKT